MKDKKELIKIIIISAVISVIASFIGCMSLIRWANGLDLSTEDFTMSRLTYSEDKGNYYTTYNGEARIYCKDNTQPYLVVVSKTLISGGMTEYIGKTYYEIVVINNGVGTISTYDSGNTGEIAQPTYKVEILGFRTLSK